MKFTWRRLALALYAAALLASTAVRWGTPHTAQQSPPDFRRVELQEVGGSPPQRRAGEHVAVTYLEWPHSGAAAPLPLVLVHGSPGAATNFRRIAPFLAEHRDVYALDLPGFGYAERSVEDYSIAAHGDYLLQFLDELGLDRVHLLGFSMGGGVILHVGDAQPERVASQILMAAIGAQEFELLGDYTLNHFVHGLQLWGLRAVRAFTPHFGAFDGGMLSEEYARNFYDTDQRPLRQILRRWQGPMLVLHGQQDPLVPAEAALEHHRLVPQSELVMRPDSHFFVFNRPAETAIAIEDFLARVERGEARVRAEADPARIAAANRPFDPASISPWTGPALLVVLPLIALSTFISEDLTCVAAGVLAAQGRISLLAAILACYVGIVLGDLLLFWLGRSLGRSVVRRAPLRWWISEEALEQSSRWLAQRGALVVLLSRFLPGARLPTNVAAGVLRTRGWSFLLYFAVAGLLWTPPVVWLSAKLGEQLLPQLAGVRGRLVIAALLLALFMWVVRRFFVPLLTHRGRRRLYGRLERIRHWEFWPWWLVYPPVVLTMLRAGLRHRDLLLFTAVNPAMPAGGFLGESKSDILRRIPGGVVPAWRLLPSPLEEEQAVRAVRQFLATEQLDYPLVLKPDRGERGDHVEVVHHEAAVRAYLQAALRNKKLRHMPIIVQQYARGVEFGVFWARGPLDAAGQLLSINEKRRPVVVGDGRRSLETLMLDDQRAAALLDKYCREHPDAAVTIPAAGEEVRLVEVGAHKRGTIFLDARHQATPELHAAITEIAEGFEGFDFGRLDVKAPSLDDFRAGRNLAILEINGVTSEVAHVYDRRFSWWRAVAELRAQWRECYRIGAQRRLVGQPVWTWKRFGALLLGRSPQHP